MVDEAQMYCVFVLRTFLCNAPKSKERQITSVSDVARRDSVALSGRLWNVRMRSLLAFLPTNSPNMRGVDVAVAKRIVDGITRNQAQAM